jgi:hypothetical protein
MAQRKPIGIQIQTWNNGPADFSIYDPVDGWKGTDGAALEALRNVAGAVLANTEVVRQRWSGRPATYATNIDTIAQSGRQLAEMVLALLEGKPPTVNNDDSPF